MNWSKTFKNYANKNNTPAIPKSGRVLVVKDDSEKLSKEEVDQFLKEVNSLQGEE